MLLSAPFAAFASVHIGGDYFLKGSETVQGDLYMLGDTGTFAGTVQGDIVALASDMVSESTVKADMLLIGGKVTLAGTGGDDARLIGQTVTVSGTVADDVVVFGTHVLISPTASVGGNLYIIGGDVSIQGKVAGEVRVYARKIAVAGTIGGTLESWGETQILSGASIGGDVIYHSESKVTVPEGAKVKGEVLQGKASVQEFGTTAYASLFRGFSPLLVLMLLAFGFLLLFLARARTEEVLLDILQQFGQRLVRGVLVVISGPVLIGLLLISIVGIPVALLLICVYVSFLILGSVVGTLILGAWCERLLFKQSAFPLSYRPVVVGTLAYSLITLLPFVGFPAFLILLSMGVGGLGTVGYRHLREIR